MLFIAEIGSNHKGRLPIAYEMIRQAAAAGADIAKFQFRDAADLIRGMPIKNARILKEWCEMFGLEFVASIFDFKGLQVAVGVEMQRAKIAHQVSRDDERLTRHIMEHFDEGFISGYQRKVGWMNLFVSPEYPTYPNIHIPAFGVHWHGYSSHAHGIADALVAISRGAKVIEKHVTLNKTEASIKDNFFAVSFDEFANMVAIGREMEAIL